MVKFYNNIIVKDTKEIIYNEQSLVSLRTLYHEIGHAKRYYDKGSLITRLIVHNYEEMLNESWNILRDEYIAEMFCANIIKLKKSVDWYGNFNDDIETQNFEFYLSEYQRIGLKLDGNIVFQLLHQYYFIPLFYKAGFLNGVKNYISLDDVKICDIINDIQNCNVVENKSVPQYFNEIVLRKWSDFRIGKKIINNL